MKLYTIYDLVPVYSFHRFYSYTSSIVILNRASTSFFSVCILWCGSPLRPRCVPLGLGWCIQSRLCRYTLSFRLPYSGTFLTCILKSAISPAFSRIRNCWYLAASFLLSKINRLLRFSCCCICYDRTLDAEPHLPAVLVQNILFQLTHVRKLGHGTALVFFYAFHAIGQAGGVPVPTLGR